MNDVYIGKIVSTHGIKGEIRIISDFPYKEKAFKVGSSIIIDQKSYKINSYRRHKNYDMITLDGYHDINDVMFLIKAQVFKKKEELNLLENEVLDSDLLEYKIFTEDGTSGTIKEIFYASPTNKIIRAEFMGREVLIPFSSPMIQKIDYLNKTVIVTLIEGM